MNLRPYQIDACDKLRRGWQEFKRQIGVAASAAADACLADFKGRFRKERVD